MKNHLRYIFYIELIIEGDEIRRFINICRKDDITFIHMKYDGKYENRITVRMTRKDFFKLRKYIRLTHVHIKVTGKAYPVYFLFRYRKHYSFLTGMVVMFVVLRVLGMFVWEIDCYGNHIYTDETIKKYMADNGICCAKFIKTIDCDSLEKKIRDDFDVTWACVAVKGSRVIVYIKENYSMEKADGNTMADGSGYDNTDVKKDIYSRYDGDIYSIITRKGTPVVHSGDPVSVNQLLVEGIVTVTDDSGVVVKETYVDSDADILVRTVIPYDDHIDARYEDKVFTGEKNHRLIVGNEYGELKAGITFGEETLYESKTENRKLYLPGHIDTKITYGFETQYEYNCIIKERNEKECRQLLEQRFDTYIKHIEQKGVQIIDCRVNIDASEKNYRCTGEIEILVDPETDIR